MTPDTSESGWVLDQALDALAAGEPREAILARFSAQAAELAPLLAAAETARQGLGGPAPSPDLARSRQRFLQAAQRTRRPALGWRASPLRLALAALVFVVLAVFGVGAASAGSLPGDALYPVKRALEDARLSVIVDPSAREAYRDALQARRRLEAAQAAERQRAASVAFEGVVEAVEPDQILVSGLPVLTPNGASAGVGDTVLVEAHIRRGAIIADTITVIRPGLDAPAPTPTHARPTPTSEPARATPTATPARPRSTPTETPARQRPTATDRPSATTISVTPEATRPSPTATGERPAGLVADSTATSDRPAETLPTAPADSRPTATPTGRPR